MATLVAPPNPQAELEDLIDRCGSQGAVARLLGREPIQVSRWRRPGARLNPKTVTLIDSAWNAVALIAEHVGEERVEVAVEQRWPGLGLRRPAELIRDGEFETLIARLSTGLVIGEVARTIADTSVTERVAADSWRDRARHELEESLVAVRGGGGAPVHEAFAFLVGMNEAELDAFEQAVMRVLEEADDELRFEDFLGSYWEGFTPARPEAAAVAERDPDETSSGMLEDLDDLLIIDGGMASRRFSEND